MLLSGNLSIEMLLINALVLLVAMTVHEFAHNYVAWRMGDPGPAQMGRLTLNPLVHINWVGWLMFVLIGFGILGSAPISPFRMPVENRRWRWLAAVAAGPLSNLILAALGAIIFRLFTDAILTGPELLFNFVIQFVFLNVLLCVFNLIPLFPIDGWQIVLALLPPDLAYHWERHRTTTNYIFFALLLLSFVRLPGIPNIFGLLISQPSQAIFSALMGA